MVKVKAISLLQPWASLIVIGAKRIETRSWYTHFRGQILIHASKRFTKQQAKLCSQWPFSEYIENLEELEFGYIIGAAELYDVTTTEHAKNDLSQRETEKAAEEYAFGDYSKGRYAWHLQDAIEFNEMIPCNGKLGLWDFEIEHPLIKTP